MLEVQSITKTFNAGTPSEVCSLRGVSLTLDPGSWVIIIGTNGSGKSTFLNAVAGTFFVDQGSIRLAGRDVTRWPECARAELIGRVFQNPFSGTSPSLSIRENLSLAARRGRSRGLGWSLKSSVVRDARSGQLPQHGFGGPSRKCHWQPFGRPAPGAHAAHGHLAAP